MKYTTYTLGNVKDKHVIERIFPRWKALRAVSQLWSNAQSGNFPNIHTETTLIPTCTHASREEEGEKENSNLAHTQNTSRDTCHTPQIFGKHKTGFVKAHGFARTE